MKYPQYLKDLFEISEMQDRLQYDKERPPYSERDVIEKIKYTERVTNNSSAIWFKQSAKGTLVSCAAVTSTVLAYTFSFLFSLSAVFTAFGEFLFHLHRTKLAQVRRVMLHHTSVTQQQKSLVFTRRLRHKKSRKPLLIKAFGMMVPTGLEPATPTLSRWCSPN